MKKKNFEDLVIFEDDDYLAINKPNGVSTLEDRAADSHILLMAKDLFPNIQACHRIDKDTSGVLILAKNPDAYKHLSMQFQNRKVRKIYHAVVHGQTEYNNHLVELPLIVKNQGIVKWDSKSGKPSSTYFTTLQNFKSFSLLECNPITGRRHQIRVHLKYCNHSIVADSKYEGEHIYLSQIKKKYKPGQREEKPLIGRMALHANSITFKTINEKDLTVEAPYPKDFQVLIKQLNKYCAF